MTREVKNRVGEKFTTNEGYEIEIIGYRTNTNCTVMFKNGHIVNNVTYSNVKRGAICNPYHPSVYNIGYYGVGKYVSKINGKSTNYYDAWKDMIRRCYSKENKIHHLTYKDVVVCDEWHNFQNFAHWFEGNYTKSFHLDKDILIKGNKVYSEETCCFVPREINALFIIRNNDRGVLPIGVRTRGNKFIATINKYGKSVHLGVFSAPEEAFQAYKIAKEAYIKEVANLWGDKITEECYKALMNYRVEIYD